MGLHQNREVLQQMKHIKEESIKHNLILTVLQKTTREKKVRERKKRRRRRGLRFTVIASPLTAPQLPGASLAYKNDLPFKFSPSPSR